VACGNKHFDGSLAGKLVLTAGLGGMGGAQPLAAKMAGAVLLGVEMDESRIHKRLETGYCDKISFDLDEALEIVAKAKERDEALSVGLVGNAAEIHPELVRRGFTPDIVTDQTSAHDVLNGYYPAGFSKQEADDLRKDDPERYMAEARKSIATHVEAMLAMQRRGAIALRLRNNIRGEAKRMDLRMHRYSGIRAGIYPPALLRRQRSVPMGRSFG